MTDTYDDGLVHCHNWACGPEAAAQPQGAEITAAAPATSAHPEDGAFDDGLVHGHDWARG